MLDVCVEKEAPADVIVSQIQALQALQYCYFLRKILHLVISQLQNTQSAQVFQMICLQDLDLIIPTMKLLQKNRDKCLSGQPKVQKLKNSRSF